MQRKARNGFAERLGPGLITGAADDDPSGIATYSQAGSQFRFGLVWTLLLTTPLMIGIQMLSARIGWVTGEGLGANIAKVCPRWLTIALVGSLVVANTSPRHRFFGWAATLVMTIAVAFMSISD